MKPKLLLLTNQRNDDPHEDVFLSRFLETRYAVSVAHPLEVNAYVAEMADILLVRNIWPTIDHVEAYRSVYQQCRQQHLKVYNPPLGSGDFAGKEYLIHLWRHGYPVIPTVQDAHDLPLLPAVDDYIVKPLYGCSSIGVRKVPRHELAALDIRGCIVQPFMRLAREVSFYFIDGVLQFALQTRKPDERWDLVPFDPTREQVRIAQDFVAWNTLPYGIQRIDFGLCENGELLLMEIEDWCPYLSLLEINNRMRSDFLQNLLRALDRLIMQW